MINIIGHAGSGTHLIIDNRVHAFSNKNAISILKNSQINVYHDTIEKVIRIKKMSERYDHKIIGKIDLHLPFNTNLRGTIKNSDLTISKVRGTIALNTESTDSDLNNLNGNINISTRGGNISATKLSGEMELNVISGDINIFDCVISFIFIYCVIQCFLKGFSLSLISFMKWIISTIVTIILVPKAQPFVSEYVELSLIHISEPTRPS